MEDPDRALARRRFLRAGATSTVAAALGSATPAGARTAELPEGRPHPLRTPLCRLLGIEHPILQAGMSGVAGPELVAEVSRAGGLGILTGTLLPPDELRRRIRRVRELTDRPFGVNFLLHSELQPPRDPARIPDHVVSAAQSLLNRFRRSLGIPLRDDRPGAVPDLLDAGFEVMLDEAVPVWSVGLGSPPPDMVERCRARGTRTVAMVASVEDAVEVAASGVDAIVAQGSEAGGHRSTWVKRASPEHAAVGTMALVPQVVDSVGVPVIAAGGISDGRGLLAALALGAQGALIGTRLIATRESSAPAFHKKAVRERSRDETTVTDVFTGMYARTLRNRFTEDYALSGAPVLPPFTQFVAARDVYEAAASQGRGELFTLYCGQGAGPRFEAHGGAASVEDMPGAGEVVRRIADEAATLLTYLPGRLREA